MNQDSIDIIRLNTGSKQAFVSLYNRYVGRIYSYVKSMLRDEALSEDVTQFCFMKVWERRCDLKPDQNFAAYLYVIAKNAVFKETRRLITSANYLDFIYGNSDLTTETTQQDVYFKMLEAEISKVIERLPESRRRIYLMSSRLCLSNQEIAQELNISPKTVETQLGRAINALRKHLEHLR